MFQLQLLYNSCLECLALRENKRQSLCHGLVTEEMENCIVQLHCFTGCDANLGFYGMDWPSIYDKVVSTFASRVNLGEEVVSVNL